MLLAESFENLAIDAVYDSSESDINKELIIPLLSCSKRYFRGVGYFSSGWIESVSPGLYALVRNGGKARFVISPVLREDELNAMELGELARSDGGLLAVLRKNVQDIAVTANTENLNLLSWLIADEFLDFRFAIPRNIQQTGIYHDKVGVFFDVKGRIVAIHGSLNDTYMATKNGESVSVFKSWEIGQFSYVEDHRKRIEDLWLLGNSQFSVHKLPDVIRSDLVDLRTSYQRPYSLVSRSISSRKFDPEPSIKCPFDLFDYQIEAISSWESENRCGILEMATGTGKTVTALSAATSLYSSKKSIFVLITVPFIHLAGQWDSVCKLFGYNPVIAHSESGRWRIALRKAVQDYNIGSEKVLCVISVNATACSNDFLRIISLAKMKNALYIADEVHTIGAAKNRKIANIEIKNRIGLSATPRRWYDEDGTHFIESCFGKVVFRLDIDEAVRRGFLVPYIYLPQLVFLTNEEIVDYGELTAKAAVYIGKKNLDDRDRENLERILRQRSKVINCAENKIPTLMKLWSTSFSGPRSENVSGSLVYCAPGTHKSVLAKMSENDIICHEFVSSVTAAKRAQILTQFANGDLDMLVAIKCLDEGVDVPSTKRAFFLSSTTNPREFVQRRGRILRKAPRKSEAEIYDFIVMPDKDCDPQVAMSIIRHEMPRFAEFTASAANKFEARSIVLDLLKQFGATSLMDIRPWEIYDQSRKNLDSDEL